MTRLSRLHPYPGMIADDLALRLCRKYVKRGYRVLDPFCGTGRTLLAAAEHGGIGVGIDTNPLATLLVSAKAGPANIGVLKKLHDEIASQPLIDLQAPSRDLENGRK